MKNKYNNKKYYEDGEKFDSALERDVYLALIEKRKNGLISGLEFQKKFNATISQYTPQHIDYSKYIDSGCCLNEIL